MSEQETREALFESVSEYTPRTTTFGHGSIALTHYPSSERVGVVQVGSNAVMDASEFVEFAASTGMLSEHDRQVAERAWDEGYGPDEECHTPRNNPYRREQENNDA